MLGPQPAGSTLISYTSGFSAGKVGIINVRIEDENGNVILAPTTADIIEIDAGGTYSVYRYLGVFPTENHWVIIWEDPSDGGIEAAMSGVSGPAPSGITPGLSSPGPCQVWATVEDMLDCCELDVGTDDTLFDQALIQATELLYMLSGAEFSGTCVATVRPTGRDCCWMPQARFSDVCVPLSRVRLAGYPVTFVVDVLIDGESISPSEYRLDQNRYLTRLVDAEGRALRWPANQRLDKDFGEDTFFVTYLYGTDPPATAVGATAQLACAIKQACPGNGATADCELPAGTVRVTRQGITIDSQALGLWLVGQMRTGMPLVDAFLAVYGKTQRKRTVLMVPETDPWPMRVS